MDELKELYQQVILDHNKSPRNYGKIACSTHQADGDNPLCGDHVHVYLQIENEIIKDISFEGNGCAISRASASLMTSALKGQAIEVARENFHEFQDMLTKEGVNLPKSEKIAKLAVLSGVKSFPLRVKCASLAWHTFIAAINDKEDTVTTK